MTNISELQIVTEGKMIIVGGYEETKEKLKEIKEFWEQVKSSRIENVEDYKTGFNVSRAIKSGQEKIKEIKKSLDNTEIISIKENLDDINKIMASKNTMIKKRLVDYKEHEKELIIESGFENVESRTKFEANFDKYRDECVLQFKGKSKFEEMQTISLTIAEQYSTQLEMYQLKYESAFNELTLFVKELDLILPDGYMEIDCLKIVNLGISKESIKEKYKNGKLNQDKALEERKQKEIEAQQRLAKESLETSPVIDTITSDSMNELNNIDREMIDKKNRDYSKFKKTQKVLMSLKFETLAAQALQLQINNDINTFLIATRERKIEK